jgi:hypothetical protein
MSTTGPGGSGALPLRPAMSTVQNAEGGMSPRSSKGTLFLGI